MAARAQASSGRRNTHRNTRPVYGNDYVQGSAAPKLRPQTAPKQETRPGKPSGSQSVRSNHRIRRNQERIVRVAQMLKTTQAELESKLEAQIGELKDIKAKLEKFKEEASLGEARSFLTAAKTVGSLKVITAQRDGMDPNTMRKLGDFLRDKEPGVVGVLASVHDGKVTLLAVCGKDAVAKGVKAGDIIKAIAPICGGKGGGKPDSAMGGGTEVSKVDDALAAVDDLVLKVVG